LQRRSRSRTSEAIGEQSGDEVQTRLDNPERDARARRLRWLSVVALLRGTADTSGPQVGIAHDVLREGL
jgi:hypothetical protein